MRKVVKQAKVRVIHQLTRQIQRLQKKRYTSDSLCFVVLGVMAYCTFFWYQNVNLSFPVISVKTPVIPIPRYSEKNKTNHRYYDTPMFKKKFKFSELGGVGTLGFRNIRVYPSE